MRVVLWDIDGTLLSSGGVGKRAFEAALHAKIGTTGDPSYRYDGKTDRQIGRELMRLAGHADSQIDSLLDTIIADYLMRLRGILAEGTPPEMKVHLGIAPLLDALEARDDVLVGLLTGNVADGAALKLSAAGLDPSRFRVGAFGSDHEVRRELPAVAKARAEAMLGRSVAGDDIVIIGDTPADIDCGRGIGARAIGVATGRYSVAELATYAPHAVFEHFGDTEAALAAICDA